jgi:glutamate carboxypeptidase
VVRSLDELARDIGRTSGATFTLTGGIKRLPLERSDASADLYRRYADAASASGLGNDECELIGGGSDANTVSAIGVPAIDGLGPRGRGFHTHDEYIEVSTLPQRVEALVRFLVAWSEG